MRASSSSDEIARARISCSDRFLNWRLCATPGIIDTSDRSIVSRRLREDRVLLAAHPLRRLLVLEAHLVDQLGIERDLQWHLDSPRACVRLWVVNRDLHVEPAVGR